MLTAKQGKVWAYLPSSPPPPDRPKACSTAPGWINLQLMANGTTNLTLLLSNAANVINGYASRHAESACPFSSEVGQSAYVQVAF